MEKDYRDKLAEELSACGWGTTARVRLNILHLLWDRLELFFPLQAAAAGLPKHV